MTSRERKRAANSRFSMRSLQRDRDTSNSAG
jgi:hypothetical protein